MPKAALGGPRGTKEPLWSPRGAWSHTGIFRASPGPKRPAGFLGEGIPSRPQGPLEALQGSSGGQGASQVPGDP